MISDRNLIHLEKNGGFDSWKEYWNSGNRNVQVSKYLVPPQMHEIFKLKDQSYYNLRYNSPFSTLLVKSVYKGTEILSFLGPKTWDILPDTYNNMPDLNSF